MYLKVACVSGSGEFSLLSPRGIDSSPLTGNSEKYTPTKLFTGKQWECTRKYKEITVDMSEKLQEINIQVLKYLWEGAKKVLGTYQETTVKVLETDWESIWEVEGKYQLSIGIVRGKYQERT